MRLVETEITEDAAVEALPEPGEGILPLADPVSEPDSSDAGG